jgi:hypothetical protein
MNQRGGPQSPLGKICLALSRRDLSWLECPYLNRGSAPPRTTRRSVTSSWTNRNSSTPSKNGLTRPTGASTYSTRRALPSERYSSIHNSSLRGVAQRTSVTTGQAFWPLSSRHLRNNEVTPQPTSRMQSKCRRSRRGPAFPPADPSDVALRCPCSRARFGPDGLSTTGGTGLPPV